MAATLTYDDLKAKTVVDLRQLASGLTPAVQGYTQMNKEHLLEALCKAMGIQMHHHTAVVGVDKVDIKAHIRVLKKQRDRAIEAHDHEAVHTLRRTMHHYKRQLHKATVLD